MLYIFIHFDFSLLCLDGVCIVYIFATEIETIHLFTLNSEQLYYHA
jgi:hypothetical protein